jgi:hypothetical protein
MMGPGSFMRSAVNRRHDGGYERRLAGAPCAVMPAFELLRPRIAATKPMAGNTHAASKDEPHA